MLSCQRQEKVYLEPFPWSVSPGDAAVGFRVPTMVNALLQNTHLQFPSHLNTPSAPAPLRNTRKGELGHTWALRAPKVTQLSKPKGLQQAFHLLMGSFVLVLALSPLGSIKEPTALTRTFHSCAMNSWIIPVSGLFFALAWSLNPKIFVKQKTGASFFPLPVSLSVCLGLWVRAAAWRIHLVIYEDGMMWIKNLASRDLCVF